jgi:hypothetical protein
MENSQRNQSAPKFMHLQGFKGFLGGYVQSDLEEECVGYQRTRIQMGVLNSTLTFELETLSQHRPLIERLQDEIYALRIQIEEKRTSLGGVFTISEGISLSIMPRGLGMSQ